MLQWPREFESTVAVDKSPDAGNTKLDYDSNSVCTHPSVAVEPERREVSDCEGDDRTIQYERLRRLLALIELAESTVESGTCTVVDNRSESIELDR